MNYEKLNNLNITFNKAQIEKFDNFTSLFLDYNKKVNLISNKDSEFLFEKHIFDSLAFNLFYEKYNLPSDVKLSDIGTGGGFPAIPLALFYENMQVCAVDSINKKINFIKDIKEKLQIKNINPVCARIEDIDFKHKNKSDVVVSRAMAELRIILEYAIPFVKVGGYFVAYKSIKAEEEIENAQNALKILNAKISGKIDYTLPTEDENKRVLLIIKKEAETDKIYPRQNGIIRKKPL